MSEWDQYPAGYRSQEVQAIIRAAGAGECISVVGLSGSGKSNLLGFLTNRMSSTALQGCRFVLVDCNRLVEPSANAFFRLIRNSLGDSQAAKQEYDALDRTMTAGLDRPPRRICILLDRFDSMSVQENQHILQGNLRALRDAHKYDLTFLVATRRPLDPNTELAELFFAHTLWLGPLSKEDAHWTVQRYFLRKGIDCQAGTIDRLIQVTWGYPSFLRAACEAFADGCPITIEVLMQHPHLQKRIEEFWADRPGKQELRLSGLEGHPLLQKIVNGQSGNREPDTTTLTAKEYLLLEYLRSHPGQVCSKDDLIQAVWPEDKIFEQGIRDDSLAQLVRRLREKIEAEPSKPSHLHTVPGRGYRYVD